MRLRSKCTGWLSQAQLARIFSIYIFHDAGQTFNSNSLSCKVTALRIIREPDKREYLVIIFLISHPNHVKG